MELLFPQKKTVERRLDRVRLATASVGRSLEPRLLAITRHPSVLVRFALRAEGTRQLGAMEKKMSIPTFVKSSPFLGISV